MLSDKPRCRGSVVRSRWQNGTPWGTLLVAEQQCELTSGLGRRSIIQRSDVSVVRLEKVRLGIVTRTVLTFVDSNGKRVGLSFIPWRPKVLTAALAAQSWPVEMAKFGLGGAS
jgi:hypothetical protein